ncbi:KOW motif [Parelaphostrongylus tenuis]|uniref:KOW motif n=1 Tax=Parelaphostrongylus tenuis TaxID=148309 RepID=A0AAD5N8I2_PARTN|nr:KOW motif [Parelaphostrongylus tenuis]
MASGNRPSAELPTNDSEMMLGRNQKQRESQARPINQARNFYEKLVTQFPNAGRYWKAYIEHEGIEDEGQSGGVQGFWQKSVDDEVIIMRGRHRGNTVRAIRCYRKKFVIHVDKITIEKGNGSTVHIGIHQSKVILSTSGENI